MEIIKQVKAPVRIDFAGGTTDIYPFTHKYGGAVLNAAINKYVVGKIIKTDEKVHLEYTGNTPTSSGLGTSGVMNLVWLALISQVKMQGKKGVVIRNKLKLAEKVYDLERGLGLVGGKQDQYASALGGINFLEFIKDRVKISRLTLHKKLVKELEENLILVYTGKPHFSGNSNKAMMHNLKKGKSTRNLLRIRDIAREMRTALLKRDLNLFAELMNAETKERNKLHRSIIPLRIEGIIKKGMKNGAEAAKVCGSGGGGSILFFGDKKKLKKKFGKSIIDFKFDFDGLRWL